MLAKKRFNEDENTIAETQVSQDSQVKKKKHKKKPSQGNAGG